MGKSSNDLVNFCKMGKMGHANFERAWPNKLPFLGFLIGDPFVCIGKILVGGHLHKQLIHDGIDRDFDFLTGYL